MGSIFGQVSACTCRMALPPTAGCFSFSNSAYVKIFHNDELKYSYFDWKNEDLSDEMKKKMIAYRDEPVNKE